MRLRLVWSHVVSDVNVGKGKVLINQDVNLRITEVGRVLGFQVLGPLNP